jgi:uncharacterized membrane protein
MAPVSQLEQTRARPRLAFIDVSRSLAMLLMVQAHVCDTLLDQALKSTPFFQDYWLLRGLTAPLFFTISGFAFVVASDPHWEDYGRWSVRLLKRLRRVGALLLIGYFLQVPRWSGNPPFDFSPEDWRYFLRSGVLHCIAFSLLLAYAMLALTKTRRAFTAAAAGIGLGTVLLAPVIAGLPGTMPLPLEMILRGRNGSLFPLFPFLAHFFLGATLARLYLDAELLQRSARRLGLLLTGLALGMAASGHAWRALDPARAKHTPLGAAELSLFLSKTGHGWLVFGICALIVGTFSSPYWLKSVSSNALSIYLLHLVALYGFPGVQGLIALFGTHLSLAQAFALGPALMAACALVMAAWDWSWGWARAFASGPKRERERERDKELSGA